MNLCPRCGVDLGDGVELCPLCGSVVAPEPLPAQPPETPAFGGVFDEALAREPAVRARRLVAAETISVALAIAAASVVVIDLVTSGRLGWSRYPLASLAFAWILACPPLLAPRRRAAVVAAWCASLFAFLFVVDAMDGSVDWSVRLGFPLAAAALGLFALAATAARLSRRRGLNVVAYGLVAVAGFVLAVEAVVDAWLLGVVRFQWSSIVASALVPVAAFLVYAHYRLVKDSTLRKLFHL